jgi:hypothetical protein
VTVVECVMPAPEPFTVMVRVPTLALLLSVTVMVDNPVPGAAMELGLKLTLRPLPLTEADKLIGELKLFKAVVLIEDVPEPPLATLSMVGFALMLKSGAGPLTVTVRETVVVWVMPPPVPVTVIVYVFGVTDGPTAMVMVEVPEPGAAMEAGLKVTVTPDGWPEADKATAELKPPVAVLVTVELPELLCATEREAGEAETLKLGVGGPASALSKPLPFGLPQPVARS